MAERRTLAQLKDAAARLVFAGVRVGERDPETLAVVHGLVREAHDLGKAEGDREHIVQLSPSELDDLRKWLEHPNGALCQGRVVFAACGGGILVRTQPYRVPETTFTEAHGSGRPGGL